MTESGMDHCSLPFVEQPETNMRSPTYAKERLAVICDGAAGPQAYRSAVDIAARAWDAGSSVRVRRIGELVAPYGAAADPEWLEVLGDGPSIPEACPEDLEWAPIAVVVNADRVLTYPGGLGRIERDISLPRTNMRFARATPSA